MVKRAVIVLTDMYPFDTGEEFFEQEIETLAAAFDKVFIVPMRAPKGATLTRPLPPNATAFLLPPSKVSSWQLRALLKAVTILFGQPRMVETAPWSDFGRFGMDVRFASIALDTYERFSTVFPWDELQGMEEILFYSYWFFTGVAVADMAKKRQLRGRTVKIVSRAHAYDVDEKDAPRGYIPSRQYVMSSVDLVYPISDYAAGFLRHRFPHDHARIKVRRLGVPPIERATRRKPDTISIVSCSHFAPYKRVWLIADAVEALSRRGFDVEWTHIGERSEEKRQALRDSLVSRVPQATVNLVGYMNNADVRQFYASTALTAFVNSSDGEGVPVSIMEAQATGLPVVATSAGGTGEIVWDEKNGRLVPVDITGSDLADAIEWVHQRSIEEFAELCANARSTWESMSDARRQYTEFVEGLREI